MRHQTMETTGVEFSARAPCHLPYIVTLENDNGDAIADQMICVGDPNCLVAWKVPLRACLSEFGANESATPKVHFLFTRENVVRIVRNLICNHEYSISRDIVQTEAGAESIDLSITFNVQIQSSMDDVSLNASDSLTFALVRENIAPKPRTRRAGLRTTSLNPFDLHGLEEETSIAASEMAALDQMMEFRKLVRESEIQGLIQRAIIEFGSNALDYDVARRVFAAEVDGIPIVFPIVTNVARGGWLRSIICYHKLTSATDCAELIPKTRCRMLILEREGEPVEFQIAQPLQSSVSVVIDAWPKTTPCGELTTLEQMGKLPSGYFAQVPRAYSAILGTAASESGRGLVPRHISDFDPEISRELQLAVKNLATMDIPKSFLDSICAPIEREYILQISGNKSTIVPQVVRP